MTAWLSLTKKEFRLGFPAFLIPPITFSLVSVIVFLLGHKTGIAWDIISVLGVIALVLHTLYIAYYMLYSLAAERKKLHLWLHNPSPGYKLLLAKITAGFISLLLSMLYIGIIIIISTQFSVSVSQYINWMNIKDLLLFTGSHLILYSIYFGVILVFFWMIFLLFTKSLNTFVSFILTLVLFIVSSFLYGWFSMTSIYEMMTHWGPMNITDLITGISLQGDSNLANTELTIETEQLTIYLGTYLFETIITVLLFIASCWILDKKVEV